MGTRMTHAQTSWVLAAAALGVLALLESAPACAALGEPAESVARDGQKLKAQVRATAATGFTVHEMTLDSGTVVREYVGPDQRVFAVSWSGPQMPDVRQLLGSYYGALQAAPRPAGPRATQRHLDVRTGDLVVQSSGHMRAWSGRAYVASMLPQGVPLDQIR